MRILSGLLQAAKTVVSKATEIVADTFSRDENRSDKKNCEVSREGIEFEANTKEGKRRKIYSKLAQLTAINVQDAQRYNYIEIYSGLSTEELINSSDAEINKIIENMASESDIKKAVNKNARAEVRNRYGITLWDRFLSVFSRSLAKNIGVDENMSEEEFNEKFAKYVDKEYDDLESCTDEEYQEFIESILKDIFVDITSGKNSAPVLISKMINALSLYYTDKNEILNVIQDLLYSAGIDSPEMAACLDKYRMNFVTAHDNRYGRKCTTMTADTALAVSRDITSHLDDEGLKSSYDRMEKNLTSFNQARLNELLEKERSGIELTAQEADELTSLLLIKQNYNEAGTAGALIGAKSNQIATQNSLYKYCEDVVGTISCIDGLDKNVFELINKYANEHPENLQKWESLSNELDRITGGKYTEYTTMSNTAPNTQSSTQISQNPASNELANQNQNNSADEIISRSQNNKYEYVGITVENGQKGSTGEEIDVNSPRYSNNNSYIGSLRLFATNPNSDDRNNRANVEKSAIKNIEQNVAEEGALNVPSQIKLEQLYEKYGVSGILNSDFSIQDKCLALYNKKFDAEIYANRLYIQLDDEGKKYVLLNSNDALTSYTIRNAKVSVLNAVEEQRVTYDRTKLKKLIEEKKGSSLT